MVIRAGSLFSGIGGLDLAAERAGMRVVWQCEIDRYCRRVLGRHWPDVPCYDDVTKLRGEELEPIDLLMGGFPCQDLSIAGRRAGLAGRESKLFYELVRLAGELGPRWLVIENVPGLLSSNDGRDMGAVVGALAELGYWWAYRVLDAQYFGVPQRRRRVVIVGYSGEGGSATKVLFESESLLRDTPPRRASSEATAGTLGGGSGCRGWPSDTDCMTFVSVMGDISHTLTGSTGEDGTGKGVAIIAGSHDPAYVRRLTPRECERLQGFPDDWTVGESDTRRYRMLGNAVAIPVFEWVFHRLVEEDRSRIQ